MDNQVIYWTTGEAGPEGAGLTSGYPENFLSENEIDQYRGLKFLKRREEWLIGRITIKTLLQSCLAGNNRLPLTSIEIANKSTGAPYARVKGQVLDAAITLSHRNSLAAAAVCFNPEVGLGIDLEWIEDRDGSFYSDYFTVDEQKWLSSQDSEKLSRLGTILWSAKESMLKALGLGLRVDTRSVEVKRIAEHSPDGWGEIEMVSHPGTTSAWHGYYRSIGNHVCTLAALNLKSSPTLRRVSIDPPN